jgi:hypothetical protein
MSWSENHSESESFAARAGVALHEGNPTLARQLYAKAAQAEVRALSHIDKSKVRTIGVTAVSAVALWYKAGEFCEAAFVAHEWLASRQLPPFAANQLREIVEQIWSIEALNASGIDFTGNEVLVSVSGGEVVRGGAPLDLIQQKVEQVSAMFYRTAEMLLGVPHRRHGMPSTQVREACRPWLFQAAPGSYQFAVRVQKPGQGVLFPELEIKVEQLSQRFLQIIKATAEDPEESLKEVVPDSQYRQTFLKLARQLAPAGKSYERLSVRANAQPEMEPIVFEAGARQTIGSAMRKQFPQAVDAQGTAPAQFHGILRALHLDQDWIELAVTEGGKDQHIKVYGAGDEVDDILGPMVNHDVVVDVLQAKGKYMFKDIQPAE